MKLDKISSFISKYWKKKQDNNFQICLPKAIYPSGEKRGNISIKSKITADLQHKINAIIQSNVCSHSDLLDQISFLVTEVKKDFPDFKAEISVEFRGITDVKNYKYDSTLWRMELD